MSVVMKALWLVLMLLAPGVAVAQTGPAERARAAADLLDAAGAQLEAAERASDRVKALTQTVLAFEEGLSALRSGLRQVARREAELDVKLQNQDAEVATLLAALMQIGDTTSPVLLVHPGGALATARAGMLLVETAPALASQADDLRRDLQELNRLRSVQTAAADHLEAGLQNVQRARAGLNEAIADRSDLPKRFVSDPVREAILLSSVETLDSFAAGLDQVSAGVAPPALPDMGQDSALPLPVKGAVLRQAGEADAAGMVRPGIIVATDPGALVISPVSATLRYVGPLLDFGQVVILEPQADVLFVFAGLGATYAQTGDLIEAGGPLGLMGDAGRKNEAELSTVGDDTGAVRSETLYIEVRENNSPQDPGLWFRTEENG